MNFPSYRCRPHTTGFVVGALAISGVGLVVVADGSRSASSHIGQGRGPEGYEVPRVEFYAPNCQLEVECVVTTKRRPESLFVHISMTSFGPWTEQLSVKAVSVSGNRKSFPISVQSVSGKESAVPRRHISPR